MRSGSKEVPATICPAIVSVATRMPSGSRSAPSIVAADRRAALPRETVARAGHGCRSLLADRLGRTACADRMIGKTPAILDGAGLPGAGYSRLMRGSVTVHMAASADRVWHLVSDITRVGEFSPETFEAEWLDGARGPVPGARFRGHVRRHGGGAGYWAVWKVSG